MSKDVSEIKQVGPLYLYLIVSIAAVGGFLFGYDMALIGPAMLYLKDVWGLTPLGEGAIKASADLGCPFGCLAAIWIADAMGRNRALIVSAVMFLASGLGCAFADSSTVFNIWRFIGGAGVGLASTVSPMYIAEIAPARLRGRLVVINQLANVMGIVLSSLICYFIAEHAKANGIPFGNWQMMFLSLLVPATLLLIGLFFVPKSPRWLAMRGREKEAVDVLSMINGNVQAERELGEIKNELGQEEGGFRELWVPGVRTALFIAIGLMVLSQVNGANMVLGYSPRLFVAAGITENTDAIWNSLYVFAWITFTTISAFWLTAKFGRRPILIFGVLGIAVGNFLMFVQFAFKSAETAAKSDIWLTLTAMFTSAGAFTLTLAPLSWVILSEIFPNRIRGKAMSIATVVMFTAAYFTSLYFPVVSQYFVDKYGNPGGTWLIFAVIDLVGVFLLWRFLPETKDKTLESIGTSVLRAH